MRSNGSLLSSAILKACLIRITTVGISVTSQAPLDNAHTVAGGRDVRIRTIGTKEKTTAMKLLKSSDWRR